MKLYFMRHGVAVKKGSFQHTKDSERPLTVEGEEKIGMVAKGLKGLKLNFDTIVSSPYQRVSRTAEIVAAVLGAQNKLKFSDHLAEDADPRGLIKEINEQYPEADDLLLVGHESYLSRIITRLLTGQEQYVFLGLKKGGICCVETEQLAYKRCAMLNWLMSPR